MSEATSPKVTVIIATLADANREASLRRAIKSVESQCEVDTRVHLIVNGKVYSYEALDQLRSNSVEVYFENRPSLPGAIFAGRRTVSTPFFCFLDDDDELLPNSIASRVLPMLQDQTIDLVVGNGLSRTPNGASRIVFEDMNLFRSDPFSSVFRRNWLASCGAVYRTATVSEDIFFDLPSYYEWTLVACRILVRGLRPSFLDSSTFVINETEGSLSRSSKYIESSPIACEEILALALPRRIKQHAIAKYCDVYHSLCGHHLSQGRMLEAFSAHVRSLRYRHGFVRYLLYSRRIFFAWFSVGWR